MGASRVVRDRPEGGGYRSDDAGDEDGPGNGAAWVRRLIGQRGNAVEPYLGEDRDGGSRERSFVTGMSRVIERNCQRCGGRAARCAGSRWRDHDKDYDRCEDKGDAGVERAEVSTPLRLRSVNAMANTITQPAYGMAGRKLTAALLHQMVQMSGFRM